MWDPFPQSPSTYLGSEPLGLLQGKLLPQYTMQHTPLLDVLNPAVIAQPLWSLITNPHAPVLYLLSFTRRNAQSMLVFWMSCDGGHYLGFYPVPTYPYKFRLSSCVWVWARFSDLYKYKTQFLRKYIHFKSTERAKEKLGLWRVCHCFRLYLFCFSLLPISPLFEGGNNVWVASGARLRIFKFFIIQLSQFDRKKRSSCSPN
jgi:hypothetical protein